MERIIILLATYNGENFIKAQLDSILNQNFKAFKLVVADDASIDKTRDILLSYKEKFKDRLELIFNKKSLGVKKNFLKLLYTYLDEANYFMFCDQDDIWLENKISLSLKKIKEIEGIEVIPSLVHTDLSICDSELNIIERSMNKKLKLDKIDTFAKLLVENKVTGNTIIINRELAIKAFSPKLPKDILLEFISNNIVMHDWYLALVAAYIGNIYFINKSLVLYRQHNKNVCGLEKNNIKDIFLRKLNAKNIYSLIYKQANLIYNINIEDNQNKKILKDFILMQDKSRFYKIYICLKHKIYKKTFLLTISKFFSI